MNDRTDLPRIRPTEPVSFFNREAGGWGFLGAILGGVAAAGITITSLLAVGVPPAGLAVALENTATPLFATVAEWGIAGAGILFGGLKGMARQQQEIKEGRVVKQPTGWNSGIWSGLLVGSLMFTAVALAAPALVALLPAEAAFTATATAATGITLSIASLAMPIIGAIIGSNIRKDSMQRDLDQAVGLRNEEIGALKAQMRAMEQSVSPQQTYMNSVSPGEAQVLESKLADRSHAEAALADRAATPEAAR